MSQAKVETVKKSRKAQKPCGKCGVELPVGSAYRSFYVGYRSTYKNVRCMKSECYPRPSELESSKLADVYSAFEAAEDTIREADNWDDIKSALDEAAEAVRQVASEYEEASEDQNGNVFNTDAEERAQTLESAADEIENIDKEDTTMDCTECNGTHETKCGDCDGSGVVDGDDDRQCPECVGDGTVECTECDENGSVIDLDTMRDEAIDEMNSVDLP